MGQNRRMIGWKWWTEFAIAQDKEIEATEETKPKEVAKYKQ